ncbi:hypothetical protein LY79DRAFT_178661 [Colletotrichum navitas]|uniref:Uncharacterized protein n=1 Tax=Colletotrichum navitas TaxID=681940 RepID=A0AAD8V6K5_9PEZI|nr:hypothetical protein LY79DRAFT_178661 [Colletotrichum navitas]
MSILFETQRQFQATGTAKANDGRVFPALLSNLGPGGETTRFNSLFIGQVLFQTVASTRSPPAPRKCSQRAKTARLAKKARTASYVLPLSTSPTKGTPCGAAALLQDGLNNPFLCRLQSRMVATQAVEASLVLAATSVPRSLGNNKTKATTFLKLLLASLHPPATCPGEWFPWQLSALFCGAHGHSNAGIYFQASVPNQVSMNNDAGFSWVL